MTKYHYKYESKFTVAQLYDLVMDVEKYPEFLPWCTASRIVDESENMVVADLIISFKAFSEHYRSKIEMLPPKQNSAEVYVSMISGPFKHLSNHWKFKRLKGKGVTRIDFAIDFEFKSSLLEKLIGLMFNKACQKMVAAFESRADSLYGAYNGTASTKRNRSGVKKET